MDYIYKKIREDKNDIITGLKGSNYHVHMGIDWERNEKFVSITDENYPVGDPRRNVVRKSWSMFQPSPIDDYLRENPTTRKEIDSILSVFDMTERLLGK